MKFSEGFLFLQCDVSKAACPLIYNFFSKTTTNIAITLYFVFYRATKKKSKFSFDSKGTSIQLPRGPSENFGHNMQICLTRVGFYFLIKLNKGKKSYLNIVRGRKAAGKSVDENGRNCFLFHFFLNK